MFAEHYKTRMPACHVESMTQLAQHPPPGELVLLTEASTDQQGTTVDYDVSGSRIIRGFADTRLSLRYGFL